MHAMGWVRIAWGLGQGKSANCVIDKRKESGDGFNTFMPLSHFFGTMLLSCQLCSHFLVSLAKGISCFKTVFWMRLALNILSCSYDL